MTVTNWTTTYIDGKEYLAIEVAQFRIPLDWDPSSNMFIAVAAPDGGLGGFPALVQGDNGETPNIDNTINFTALAWDNPEPDDASWTEIAENVYRLNLTLHNGNPGLMGAFRLQDATDLSGTIAPGRVLQVNSGGSTFQYSIPKIGDRYFPATISGTPSGNASYTLCAVSVPAQPWDWRPTVSGQCVVTGTGSDVRVDLVARLNDANSGNIVGRAIGGTELLNGSGITTYSLHVHPTHVLSAGPPAGSADNYDKVSAGSAAIIYLRAERQSGSQTFTTSASTTTFQVRVDPIP